MAPNSIRFCFRNVLFCNVSEASQTRLREVLKPLMTRPQIPVVLRGSWLRGCETLVLVRFLNLSVSALYSILMHSTPLYSTLLLWAAKHNKTMWESPSESKKTYICNAFETHQRPRSKNVLPGNVSEASTQLRGWETSQLRLLTVTPKHYKTKHISAISQKMRYICNVSELRGKGLRKKRRAR